MRFLQRWLCRHGFHAWELWITATEEREICSWCGKVSRRRA